MADEGDIHHLPLDTAIRALEHDNDRLRAALAESEKKADEWWRLKTLEFERSNHWQARAEQAERERDEARDYLARLFVAYAPECIPLPGLLGVCTQIDNLLVGFRDCRAALRAVVEAWDDHANPVAGMGAAVAAARRRLVERA